MMIPVFCCFFIIPVLLYWGESSFYPFHNFQYTTIDHVPERNIAESILGISHTKETQLTIYVFRTRFDGLFQPIRTTMATPSLHDMGRLIPHQRSRHKFTIRVSPRSTSQHGIPVDVSIRGIHSYSMLDVTLVVRRKRNRLCSLWLDSQPSQRAQQGTTGWALDAHPANWMGLLSVYPRPIHSILFRSRRPGLVPSSAEEAAIGQHRRCLAAPSGPQYASAFLVGLLEHLVHGADNIHIFSTNGPRS